MQFLNRRIGEVAILLGAFALAGCCTAADAQEGQPSPVSATTSTGYISLERRSVEQMDPADTSLVNARQAEIANEAEMFGYDLRSEQWTSDQTLCPDISGYAIIHYANRSRNGAESRFTVLVPRAQGRVLVVPVSYRNATPYKAAAASQRTIAVFNRVVPAEAAQKAMQPNGGWLRLGMCYAAIAGAEPEVPTDPSADLALVKASRPTLQFGVGGRSRQILFTDRDASNQYALWSITVNDSGRVTAADSTLYSAYVASAVPQPVPPEQKPVPEAAPSKWKLVPPAPAPTEKPIPPN